MLQSYNSLQQFLRSSTTTNAQVMNAAGEKVGFVFPSPRTASISGFWIRLSTVTTGQPLLGSIQTPDISTGFPNETIIAAGASGTVTVADGDDNTWKFIGLTTPYAATAGQMLAFTIDFAGTAGDLQITCSSSVDTSTCYANLKAPSWTGVGRGVLLLIEWMDGVGGTLPGINASFTSTDYNNGSNPDELGLRFSVPFATICTGALWKGRSAGTATEVKLYDSNGTTVLASGAVFQNVQEGTSDGNRFVRWASPVTLTINTFYRIGIWSQTAGTVRVYQIFAPTSGQLIHEFGQIGDSLTQRNNLGAWTETMNTRPMIYPEFSSFSDNVGSGSSTFVPILWD